MLATILFAIPIGVLPTMQLPEPTRDCQIEVLTPDAIDERAIADFETRLDAYVVLQRRVVRSMGTAEMPDEEGERFFGDELRSALIAARPHARRGSLFTPAVETAFRVRIDRGLLRGLPVTARGLYEPLPGEPSPEVNAAFPAVAGAVAWPALFMELPALPSELGYALWGRDLVLVDLVANLVLDVLSEALPEGAYPGVLYQ